MKDMSTNIGLLLEIVKPTSGAAAVDNFNCGGICNVKDDQVDDADHHSSTSVAKSEVVTRHNDKPGTKAEMYAWDVSSENDRSKEDSSERRDDQERQSSAAHPDYSEYARDCEGSNQRQDPEENSFIKEVNSADVEDEGCLFGEFGFGQFIGDLFSSLNPFRLVNLRDELKKAKESNAKLEWELKTQLLRLRQEREAMESKLRHEIDNEISQTEALHSYFEALQEDDQASTEEAAPTQTSTPISDIPTNTPKKHQKERHPSKDVVKPVSSTIGVLSSTTDSTVDFPEADVLFSVDRTDE